MAETPRRAPPSLKIKCKSATLDDFLSQFGQDIARRGVFVKTKSPLANGTALRFEFLLASGAPAFSGVGKVVWRRVRGGGELPNGMGIEFIDLPDESRQLVERVATTRVGMLSRFEQQNDAEIDPEALRGGRPGATHGAPGEGAPAQAARASLPRLAAPAPASSLTPAAGVFRSAGARRAPEVPAVAPATPRARTPDAGGPLRPDPAEHGGAEPDAAPQPVSTRPAAEAPPHDAPEDLARAEPDSSGLRPTPLPPPPAPDDLESQAAVESAQSLERAGELPTGSLNEALDDFDDDFEEDDDGIGEVARLAAHPSTAPSTSFEERLASLAPPPRSRAWVVTVFVVVLSLAAAAGYVALQGDQALRPLFDWIDRL